MKNDQDVKNYYRIAKAIDYIKAHFQEQPSLQNMAEAVNLSPFHFQRLFSEWAGVSPKKFMQYLSIEYAKQLLKEKQSTLMDAAFETGLSGASRLHDLFITIEGMTPGEYKNGGKSLTINYCFASSPFGNLMVASTPKGICHMFFEDDEKQGLFNLQARFPNASYQCMVDKRQQDALFIFQNDWSQLHNIKLHLHGTSFQLNVWKSLLSIPLGQLMSYGSIANSINSPKASRAVGSAIGRNPVAFLIPCHRVIQSTGKLGNYMWGSTRKSAIIGWEASRVKA